MFLLLRYDSDQGSSMGRFMGWLSGQQCTGIHLITISEHGSICLYYITLINEQEFF